MHNLNRFHLNGLRALEAAGRLGSLRAAAEEQFGRPMFERHPKGLRPTPFGQEVLRYLSAGFAEISAGLALADRRRDSVLTVSVTPMAEDGLAGSSGATC
ncbi:hypothetical protein [Microvirga pakistanensis]|uniref:hypothetical protein n=1 Tax=Microvirga pakistanensis TaxID=1682650 RepID=UPI0018759317|nr:hypothetical protein [Microvirga pakistanensis]